MTVLLPPFPSLKAANSGRCRHAQESSKTKTRGSPLRNCRHATPGGTIANSYFSARRDCESASSPVWTPPMTLARIISEIFGFIGGEEWFQKKTVSCTPHWLRS